MVREVGLILSNIPVEHYQAIGWYFLAVAANSMGNGDQDEARRLFELVVDSAPDPYKAKAMSSLGALAIRRNDFDSASQYFQGTIRMERVGEAALQAIRGMSILKSIEGFHKSAIADLENVLPLVRFAPLKVLESQDNITDSKIHHTFLIALMQVWARYWPSRASLYESLQARCVAWTRFIGNQKGHPYLHSQIPPEDGNDNATNSSLRELKISAIFRPAVSPLLVANKLARDCVYEIRVICSRWICQ